MTPARIYVAGHCGMVGSAIVRTLQQRGTATLITCTHAELDLTQQAAVRAFFEAERPEQVYLAPLPKSAAFTPTRPTRPNSFTRT